MPAMCCAELAVGMYGHALCDSMRTNITGVGSVCTNRSVQDVYGAVCVTGPNHG